MGAEGEQGHQHGARPFMAQGLFHRPQIKPSGKQEEEVLGAGLAPMGWVQARGCTPAGGRASHLPRAGGGLHPSPVRGRWEEQQGLRPAALGS